MLRVRLLGTPSLEGDGESSAPSILHKPKRFAVLAYLAAAQPHGHHRRDTLVGLLWSEFEQRRARAALNRTLYDLRQDLGEGIVVSHGNDDVGIERERVWCDVVAFERALDEGELEGALELYRGELLRGFYVPGAPEFERWLDQERARLRGRAVRAALQLAETEHDARFWTRRALEIDPDDERVLRHRLAALDASGDRAKALSEYEAFARRVSEEFGVEPAPETRALVEAIRARDVDGGTTLESRVGATAGGASRGTGGAPAPDADAAAWGPAASASPDGGADWMDASRLASAAGHALRRGPWPIVAVLGLVAVGLLAVLRRPEPVPTAGQTVVVLPFEFRGDPSLGYLAEGVANLLTADLSVLPGVQSIDPRAVLATAEPSGGRVRGPREGRDLATQLGAEYFVLGDIVEVRGRLRVSASVYPTSGDRVPLATVRGEATPDQIFALTTGLALDLFEQAAGERRLANVAASATRSLPALEAFVEGERALRAGRFRAAQEHFRHAVRADTAFAFAYLRLSQSANWTGADWLAHSAAEAALRHGTRLTDRQLRLARAWRAYVRGAAIEAERTYRALVAEDSLNADAWFYLGETLFHWGPTFGWPPEDARDAFGRVLSFEPRNAAAIVHLARLAADAGDLAALETLAERLRQLDPTGDHTLEVRALRAWVSGDEDEQRRLRSELRLVDHPTLWQIAKSVAVHAADPGAAISLVPLLVPGPDLASGDPGGHLQVRVFAAILEAARGRFADAGAWLDSAAVLDPAKALEWRGVLAVHPYAPNDRAALQAVRDEIERYRAPDPDWPRSPLNRPQRPMLFGILATRTGDPLAVERALAEVEAPMDRAVGAQLRIQTQRTRALLRAEISRAAGDLEAALDALDSFPLHADSIVPVYDVDHERGYLRWLRAELLHALDRDDEALRWYATFPDPGANDLIYLAPAHLQRARILEARGQTTAAARHYARVVRIWRDADPPLQPLVDEARRGLARLGGSKVGPLSASRAFSGL